MRLINPLTLVASPSRRSFSAEHLGHGGGSSQPLTQPLLLADALFFGDSEDDVDGGRPLASPLLLLLRLLLLLLLLLLRLWMTFCTCQLRKYAKDPRTHHGRA